MKDRKRKLILEQTSRKLKPFEPIVHIPVPPEGWVKTVRTALNMSLVQLAKRMGIKSPSLKNFEKREKAGTITLQSLRDIAEAMDMKLIYAIVPREGSLEDMVDQKATEKAREIVNRTSISMSLEDQENPKERLRSAFEEKRNELKTEIPKFLWD